MRKFSAVIPLAHFDVILGFHVVISITRDHKIPLNSRYHFFDSRNGETSVMLVKLPMFGFLVIILAK